MARRIVITPALAALAAALFATSAFAHAGNPNYESLVEGISPHVPGFSVVVLNGDDRLEAVNHSSRTITIDGYNQEPYILMEAGGAVSVNVRSPAYYLNSDREGTAPIPASADPGAVPRWKLVARDGRYQFHDHRIHWMGAHTPQQVKDTSARTEVVDWKVPLHAGASDGAITGTLFWRGSAGGPPAGAFVALALLVLAGAATVLVVRRRRREADTDGAGDAGKPPAEAW
jgi:hypothetical protein